MKTHTSFRLPHDIVERARNLADHHRGPPNFLSLNALVTQAIERELKRLEAKHNNGEPYARARR